MQAPERRARLRAENDYSQSQLSRVSCTPRLQSEGNGQGPAFSPRRSRKGANEASILDGRPSGGDPTRAGHEARQKRARQSDHSFGPPASFPRHSVKLTVEAPKTATTLRI